MKRLPKPIAVFLYVSLALTLASLAFSTVCRLVGLGLPYSFPYYFVPGDMFGDFGGFGRKFEVYGTGDFFGITGGYFMYPAPMVFVVRLFYIGSVQHVHILYRFIAFVVVLSLAFAWKGFQILRSSEFPREWLLPFITSLMLLSYPFVFELQRANFEIIVWAFTTVAVWSFYRGKSNSAAVALGFAIALKLYPFILLGMFFSAKKYRAMALSVLIALSITVASLAGIGPSLHAAYTWNAHDLAQFSSYYAGKPWALGYDHSFFAILKFAFRSTRANFTSWVRPYTFVAAVFGVVLYFWRIWRLPLINQIVALSILTVCLPPVSYDYTLLSLYPALFVLIVLTTRATQAGVNIPYMSLYMFLFALILTPESYVIFSGAGHGAQLRVVAMLVILGLTLAKPLPRESDFEPPAVQPGLQIAA